MINTLSKYVIYALSLIGALCLFAYSLYGIVNNDVALLNKHGFKHFSGTFGIIAAITINVFSISMLLSIFDNMYFIKHKQSVQIISFLLFVIMYLILLFL